MTIHRILSLFLTLGVILPLYIAAVSTKCIWQYFNCFHYRNFWENVHLPDEYYKRFPPSPVLEVLGRVILIHINVIVEFGKDIRSGLAQIKL